MEKGGGGVVGFFLYEKISDFSIVGFYICLQRHKNTSTCMGSDFVRCALCSSLEVK